jgi:hypothetical protein
MAKNDLQGTLDLLILKTLSQVKELHGYGIVLHIQRASDDLLRVEEGSLYPALHRAKWVDQFHMGVDGDQPQGKVLQVDGCWEKAVAGS